MIDLYKSILFDCDGVILNSNKIKTDAFFHVVKEYGQANAYRLVNYHKKNGGVSRDHKFKYFLTQILNKRFNEKTFNQLKNKYGDYVIEELIKSETAESLSELRSMSKNKWFIVSGGNEKELREVFKKKDIIDFFDGGIFGSPKSKDQIFRKITKMKNFMYPAVYLGDSEYDYKAAKKAKIDFIFIYEWTEFSDWKKFCLYNNVKYVKNLQCLFLKN